MRIGLNLLYLIPGVVGGTQTYAVELIRALAEEDRENEYVMFVNREAADLEIVSAPNFSRVVCQVNGARRAARYAWEQLALPVRLARSRVDLVHSMGYVGPLRTPCPHIVTIHDLIYQGYRQSMGWRRQAALKLFVGQTARRCDHVVTVSESSRNQLASALGLPRDRISVIYEGPRRGPAAMGDADALAVLGSYGLTTPYIVAFSGAGIHKNIPRLVEAFGRIAGTVPHRLALVGRLPEGSAIDDAIAAGGAAGRIVVTGYVPDSHVALLIAGSDLLVFPSWYEGFGLPVLDAQQAGVPVTCSCAASLPEVAGEGAVLFDPYSVDEMASAIERCLKDEALRSSLIELGHRNLERFSWQSAARKTADLYRRFAKVSA
jgi:glycosyltransferase involved in cell wall biosynthesis